MQIRHSGGQWAYYDGLAVQNIGAVTAESWYRHKIKINLTSSLFSWYIYDMSNSLLFSAVDKATLASATALTDLYLTSATNLTNEDYTDVFFSYPLVTNEPTVTYVDQSSVTRYNSAKRIGFASDINSRPLTFGRKYKINRRYCKDAT